MKTDRNTSILEMGNSSSQKYKKKKKKTRKAWRDNTIRDFTKY